MAANTENHACMCCEKSFSKKKYLVQHVRHVHVLDSDISGNLRCSVSGCSSTFRLHSQFRTHLQQFHHVSLADKEILKFQSFEEFKNWKKQEEQKTVSSYIKKTAPKAGTMGMKTYYICHRSGEYTPNVPESERERFLKAQGSTKTGTACPSIMNAVVGVDGMVEVTYFKSHHGHSNHLRDLGMLHLTPEERESIAAKRRAGITVERILKDIRDSIVNESFKRIHLITRKDIINVDRSSKIGKEEQLHSSDSVSVDLTVNRMQAEGDSVLFYKRQGSEHPTLGQNDFMLVIMTPMQRKMLEDFGKNSRICIDSTHGTTGYDFYLTTLLVIDEFGSGFPVCFCLSTKTDYTAMHTFFSSIKQNLGTIFVKFFMSDDAPAYINAWCDVMGPVGQHLLCAWHVEKNWQNNLCKVAGDEPKGMVCKIITTLLYEPNKETFVDMLKGAVELLTMCKETEEFGDYFKKYYAKRPDVWAYCYREQAVINTNMHLESLHKVLKYTYFQGRHNKRVDRCIRCLLQLVRDKTCERIVKLAKGSLGGRLKSIHLSHRKGQEIHQHNIVCLEHNLQIGSCECGQYSVQSDEAVYVVRKLPKDCTYETCNLICKSCRICIHDYSCNCMNCVVHCNICKHIHAVARFDSFSDISESQKHEAAMESNMEAAIHNIRMERTEQKQSSGECREMVSQELQRVLDHVQGASLPDDVWQEVLTGARNLLEKVIKNYRSCSLQLSETSEPSNKKIEKQKSFISVKQKKSTKRINEKPTQAEMALIADSLTGV